MFANRIGGAPKVVARVLPLSSTALRMQQRPPVACLQPGDAFHGYPVTTTWARMADSGKAWPVCLGPAVTQSQPDARLGLGLSAGATVLGCAGRAEEAVAAAVMGTGAETALVQVVDDEVRDRRLASSKDRVDPDQMGSPGR